MRRVIAFSLLLLVTVADAFGYAPSILYGSKASAFSGKLVARKASLAHSVNLRTTAGNAASTKMVIY
jgi:hypothetical protein